MLETIVKQEIIFYVMGTLTALGIFAKCVSYFTVRRMVKAAGEIQKSNHKLMKLVKAKFEHASLISDKVQNVDAFVEKYIYEYKVFGMRLGGWRSFPKKILWVIGILGVFAIFESFRMGGVSDLMMKYAQWTGIYVMFLLLLGFVAEENSRLSAAKNYMVEYLENVCIHRYAKMNRAVEQTEEIMEEIKEEEAVEVEEELSLDMAERTPEELEKNEQEKEQEKTEQEMRIRAILEEFLA